MKKAYVCNCEKNKNNYLLKLAIMKMKKLLGIFLMGAFCIAPLAAQNSDAPEKVELPSKLSRNWYLQLQGGVNYSAAPGIKDTKFFKMLSPAAAIAVGKEFTPLFGARVQLTGWQSKGTYSWKDDQYKHSFIQGNVDATLNITNVFRAYNKDNVFNLYGLAGFAYVHGYSKTLDSPVKGGNARLGTSNQIAPRVGLKADFMIAENISLNAELAANLLDRKFTESQFGSKSNEGLVAALAGITVHFNRGFDVVDYIDPATFDNLNNQVNTLRSNVSARDSKISQLEADLAKKPKEIVKTEEVEEILMNAVVVFRIGTATLQDNQEINIFNAAKFFQDNQDYDCVITGYADKSTGNAKINQALSEKRAAAVADVMTKKFGIPASRITTKADGDSVQPFQNDVWNRVVIFTAVKKK